MWGFFVLWLKHLLPKLASFLIMVGILKEKKLYKNCIQEQEHLEVLEIKIPSTMLSQRFSEAITVISEFHQMLILFRAQKCMFAFSPSDVLQLNEVLPAPSFLSTPLCLPLILIFLSSSSHFLSVAEKNNLRKNTPFHYSTATYFHISNSVNKN